MRLLIVFSLSFLFVSSSGAIDPEEISSREAFISDSPEKLPPQNILFDRRGAPTLHQKEEKKGEKKKKKKKKEKRKKLTKKPGKRRPKSWTAAKAKARARADKRAKAKAKKAAPKAPPRQYMADDEPPDAKEGEGFDYGGVTMQGDAKVAIPGASGMAGSPPPDTGGQGQEPAFRPAPPRAQ